MNHGRLSMQYLFMDTQCFPQAILRVALNPGGLCEQVQTTHEAESIILQPKLWQSWASSAGHAARCAPAFCRRTCIGNTYAHAYFLS